MEFLPPSPEPVTSKHVARALEWAWATPRHQRTLAHAEALTWPTLYLADHPKEFEAVHDRARAAASGLSTNAWLIAFGRPIRSHHRNWAKGCGRIAAGIELGRTVERLTLTLSQRAME